MTSIFDPYNIIYFIPVYLINKTVCFHYHSVTREVVFFPGCGALLVSPPHFLAGKPGAPLSFAHSLREQRDLVARHPDHSPAHIRPGLKPWRSAVGADPKRGEAME